MYLFNFVLHSSVEKLKKKDNSISYIRRIVLIFYFLDLQNLMNFLCIVIHFYPL